MCDHEQTGRLTEGKARRGGLNPVDLSAVLPPPEASPDGRCSIVQALASVAFIRRYNSAAGKTGNG